MNKCQIIRTIIYGFLVTAMAVPMDANARKPVIYLGPQQGGISPAAIEGSTIATIVGTGVQDFNGDDIPALQADLNVPQGVEFFIDGTLLIADTKNHRIRQYDPRTLRLTTFAGNGINAATGNDGPALDAAISEPRDIAVDSFGNVYVSTLFQVRRITPSREIELFAGFQEGDIGNNVPAKQAQFKKLGGITIDRDGSLLICDTHNHKVHRIRTDNIVVTIAGTGIAGVRGDNGLATQAELNQPVDVAVDIFGRIFIAEQSGNRIRKIDNGVITTIFDSSSDPEFMGPNGVVVMNDLFVYFTSNDHRLRRFNLFESTVEVVAGVGQGGFEQDNGPSDNAWLNVPKGITLDGDGNVYLADSLNHRIRLVSIPPHNIEPTPTPTFTVTPTSTPTLETPPTPTRTPRPRTPTPTPTPRPTVTATATPTPLPQGQLAPSIPSGFSPSPNFVFFTGSTEVDIPFDPTSGKVKVLLSSSTDGTGNLQTKDTIVINIDAPSGAVQSATFSFVEDNETKTPQDITTLFEQGRNRVRVKLIDTKGAGFSNSQPIYVVVFSAPLLEDLPDIRTLVSESVTGVYDLDDFVSDRDTPISDLIWGVTISQEGPDIQRDAENRLSVGAFGRPTETTFNVVVSDGVFSVSEDISIKVSTFRLNEFVLEDAPMLADFAYVSPFSLSRDLITPSTANIADVPFDTTFAGERGLKAAHVAHGTVFLFPEFPGGKAAQPVVVTIRGERQSNPDDWDGAIIHTSSVFLPEGGIADKDFNFSAESFEGETQWSVVKNTSQPGEVFLGPIPPEPFTFITDGWGAVFVVDPGETISLISQPIELPPGPTKISMWFAVEKLDGNNDDLPTVTLALAEDSSNLTYTSVTRKEIIGKSIYQFLTTTYDVIGPSVSALIQIRGSQTSGQAEIYVDNMRVFPAKRDIDVALGSTQLPFNFDGTFETTISGSGVEITKVFSVGLTSDGVFRGDDHSNIPGGLKQSLRLGLVDPISAVQYSMGQIELSDNLAYPRMVHARAYLQVIKEGQGFSAIALTNGDLVSVTFISNDRLPIDPEWHQLTTSALLTGNGPNSLNIIVQNQNTEGALPGVIQDGAWVVFDDITLESFQDTPYLWDNKQFPVKK